MIFEALWNAAQKNELILLNGGFLDYHLRKDGQITIREIIVLPYLQRTGIGKDMLSLLKMRCKDATSIYAKCPQDLPSNGWYEKMGFELESVYETRTGRKLNCWRLKLDA